MSYNLYIAENCHQCKEVTDFLEEENVELNKINVDQGGEAPPIQLFAFPALFRDGILLHYGTDIIKHFKKKSRNK